MIHFTSTTRKPYTHYHINYICLILRLLVHTVTLKGNVIPLMRSLMTNLICVLMKSLHLIHKILSYCVIHLSLCISPSLAWLVGDHNRFIVQKQYMQNHRFVTWQPFNSKSDYSAATRRKIVQNYLE